MWRGVSNSAACHLNINGVWWLCTMSSVAASVVCVYHHGVCICRNMRKRRGHGGVYQRKLPYLELCVILS